MNHKIILSIFVMVLLVGIVMAAQTTLGTFKQAEDITIVQICGDCTFNNITSITYPNSTKILGSTDILMTKSGAEFTYELDGGNTTNLGTYFVNGVGDLSGTNTAWVVPFTITPSGNSGTANIVFFMFIILVLYTITFVGLFGRNIPLSTLGGMSLIGLGIYTITNGVIIFRDWITNYFSYITIAVGVIIAFWALLEQFEII